MALIPRLTDQRRAAVGRSLAHLWPILPWRSEGHGWIVRGRARNDIRFSGYVIHTFEASHWYVNEKTTFRDAVLLAVNLEDDADTVGAVTGQIAGTAYNLSTIPREWANRLSRNERLVEVADRLSLACLG